MRIHQGDTRSIRLREDTITETNLLDLDQWHPDLVVHRFNQNAERSSGADWEWYIGTGDKWFALRIQAKRMDGLEYRQLQHPGEGDDSYQYDTLIRSSAQKRHDCFPYYVFFNGWADWPDGVDWHGCPERRPLSRCRHINRLDLGCAAMPAHLVKAIHNGRGAAGRKVSQYLPASMPWSWLFPPQFVRSASDRATTPTTRRAAQSRATVSAPGFLTFQTSRYGRGKFGPRSWGTLEAAPTNPTVLETYRWHRAIAQQMAPFSTLDALERNPNVDFSAGRYVREMWRNIRRDMLTLPDTLDGLAPLPEHARVLYDFKYVDALPRAQRADAQYERAMALAGVEAGLGGRPRNVALFELPMGEPRVASDDIVG